MRVEEIKLEVIRRVASIDDENLLQEMLNVLNESGYFVSDAEEMYNKVKEQYGSVLKKLAE